MAQEQTPFERAYVFLKEMILVHQAGDLAWIERLPTFYSLAEQMTGPTNTWRLGAVVKQWKRQVASQPGVRPADLLLLQAQDPEPGA
jgi:hypothetical protein